MTRRTLAKTLVLCSLLFTQAAGCTTDWSVRGRRKGQFSLAVASPDANAAGDNLLDSGSVLRSGDRYSISLTVIEPLYLYVEQRTSAASTALVPRSTEVPQASLPSAVVLIPPAGFLQLDSQPGVEWIFEVASRKPLTPDQVRSEIDRASAAGDRDPPPTSDARNRGQVVWGKLDARGIGTVRFKILHK